MSLWKKSGCCSGTISNCAATRTIIKIWLGTEGSPASVYRAAQLEVPMFLGILGGNPEHWGHYCHAYRDAWLKAGHSVDAGDLAVAVHGFVGATQVYQAL